MGFWSKVHVECAAEKLYVQNPYVEGYIQKRKLIQNLYLIDLTHHLLITGEF